MLSKTIQDAINDQIKAEFDSAYLYLAMAAWAEAGNLTGVAKWMRAQYTEEVEHAMKFYDFVNDREGRVMLKGIDQPQAEFKTALEVFQLALGHERKVTGLINKLYELATKEADTATQVFLEWFITEQIEEEKQASQIVEQIKLFGGEGVALMLLDQQLGVRGG